MTNNWFRKELLIRETEEEKGMSIDRGSIVFKKEG